ncbi:MAG: NUDIX domain-containing protein [Isosphaeraceae bacterium]
MTTIPEFGTASPGAEYALRPGGYAIIFRASGEVAVVATPIGLALPGGGQEPGEAPESAAAREAAEECGLQIEVGRRVGVADELVYADAEGALPQALRVLPRRGRRRTGGGRGRSRVAVAAAPGGHRLAPAREPAMGGGRGVPPNLALQRTPHRRSARCAIIAVSAVRSAELGR